MSDIIILILIEILIFSGVLLFALKQKASTKTKQTEAPPISEEARKKQERIKKEYLNFLLYDGEEQDDIL